MNEIVQFADETQWLQMVVACHSKAMRAQWEFAIMLREGLDKFGKADARKRELIEEISTQIDYKPSTIEKIYKIVRSEAAKIALGLGLSFHHARVVYDIGAELSHTQAMLTTAAEWQWEPEKLKYEMLSFKHSPRVPNTPYNPPPVVATKNDVPPAAAADIRGLHELLSAVNRQKDLTTVGAQTLPVNMTPKENYALAVYGHVASDQLNWTRGDHYNRVVDDLKARARRETPAWAPAKLQSEITRELWQMATHNHCSTEEIILNAETAAAFPHERWQTIVIGYKHHEILRNNPDPGYWLGEAERNKWTPDELKAQLPQLRQKLNTDEIIIDIIRGVQGIQLDEQAITLTSAHGKLVITQWRIE